MTEINGSELILGELKRLGDQWAAEKAERLTADEARKKEIDAKLAAIQADQEKLRDAQKSVAMLSLPGLEVGKTSADKTRASWKRAMDVCVNPSLLDTKEYGLEREIQDQMQKAAMNTGTGAAGGFLVPTQMQDELKPQLRERSIARQLGVKVIDNMPPGIHVWVKSKGGITASHIDTEGEETGSETLATFDQVTVTPKGMAAFVPLTRQMMTQTSMDMEMWVRGEIATQIALLEDQSVFLGTGAVGAPRGVLRHPNLGFVSFAGVDYAGADQTATNKLIDMVLTSRNKFALGLSGLGWSAAPGVLYHLMKVKDGQGRPLFQTLLEGTAANWQTPSTLLRHPILDSDQIKTGTTTAERLAFGPWGEVIVPKWGTLTLGIGDQTETNWRKVRATVRGVQDYDVGVFYPDAFVHAGSDAATPDVDTTAAV